MGLTKEEANQILVNNGWFSGLNIINAKHSPTREQATKAKAHAFALLLAKVLEAKAEITKLQTSVARLESICRSGMVPKPAEAFEPNTPDVGRVQDEALAFDGWVISLLESDMSLLAAIVNPETAGGRVKSLQASFAELWVRRQKDGFKMMKGFPEVFETAIYLPKP
jgi:hypothetical protein